MWSCLIIHCFVVIHWLVKITFKIEVIFIIFIGGGRNMIWVPVLHALLLLPIDSLLFELFLVLDYADYALQAK